MNRKSIRSIISISIVLIAVVLLVCITYSAANASRRSMEKQLKIDASKHPACTLLKSEKGKRLSGAAQLSLRTICGLRPRPQQIVRKPIPGNPAVIPDGIINDPSADILMDQTTQSETSMAQDTMHGTIVVGYNDSGAFEANASDSFAGWTLSTDDGATWTDMGPLSTTKDDWILGGPGLAYDEANGYLYYSSLLCSSSACNLEKLLVARSDDGGNTWGQLVNPVPIGEWDKPFIWVDNTGGACDGYVYLVATDFTDVSQRFSRSTDNGQTWTQNPILLNSGHENCDFGAIPRVGPDGTIYVAWEDAGCISGTDPGIEVVKSTDCGDTWSAINVVTTITPIADPNASALCGQNALNGQIRVTNFPFLGVDPADSDHVFVVFNSDPDGDNSVGDDSDVYFAQSTDGGTNWSAPNKLNYDLTLNDNFMPFLDVSSSGNILVGWYDRREDENNTYLRLWGTLSTNGGTSWSYNFPISSVLFPPMVNFDPQVSDCYMGDYNFAITDGTDWHVAWGDNRRIENNPPHTGPRNDPDVYYANFPVNGPGGILVYSSNTTSGGDDDGYPDPGEILNMLVGIHSAGTAPVLNISSVLTSSTTGVTILQANSDYDDMNPGTVSLNFTPFQFHLASTINCGDNVDFVLNLTTSEGPFALPFSVQTGSPSGQPIPVFTEDFESGIGDWIATDLCAGNLLFHLTTACESSSSGHSTPTSVYYGEDSTCTYDTGEAECGAFDSPIIDLSTYGGGTLDFNYFLGTEGFCSFDAALVQVSPDGGTTWTNVAGNCQVGNLDDPTTAWQSISGIDLPGISGSANVQLRFRFDTGDGLFNNYDGFYIDDVVVNGLSFECPIGPIALQPYEKAIVNDGGNGIFEPDEAVTLQGHMENLGSSDATNVAGVLSTADPVTISDANAAYGTIAGGSDAICTDCYGVVAPLANRPGTHWDFKVSEAITATGYGPFSYSYTYHVGDSFTDVPTSQIFYSFIETILHSGVTSGCTTDQYCPGIDVARYQMGKFVCASMEASSSGSCTTTTCAEIFDDVPATNPFCPFIEALYNTGVVSGCSTTPPLYCPDLSTTREAMAKFICNSMETANPGSCVTAACAEIFGDVPATNIFCPFIEALYNGGVISGCQTSPLLYCPAVNVTRDQMAKFLVNAFNFTL